MRRIVVNVQIAASCRETSTHQAGAIGQGGQRNDGVFADFVERIFLNAHLNGAQKIIARRREFAANDEHFGIENVNHAR